MSRHDFKTWAPWLTLIGLLLVQAAGMFRWSGTVDTRLQNLETAVERIERRMERIEAAVTTRAVALRE